MLSNSQWIEHPTRRCPKGFAPDLGTLVGSATVTETILAVPERSTWVMVLIGFAIVGFAVQNRRLAGPARRAVATR